MVLQISSMEIMDFVDILVVAFLLYKLLPLFRSSGTLRIARALVVVFVGAWFTRVFHMYTINYILEVVMEVGVIAVVVLFQPEIRRILDHLGSVSITKLLKTDQNRQDMEIVINQTILACSRMSKERVGALIVFVRDNPLEEYVKKGTIVDGQYSDQLLRNIFFPKAALHDGAVIVREGRVTAAGCTLPLSEQTLRDHGTRHKAALGISEVSDAVAVVVSEESGGISVAVGGILKENLAPQTVERLLRNELMPKEEEKEESLVLKLKQKLQNNGKEGK